MTNREFSILKKKIKVRYNYEKKPYFAAWLTNYEIEFLLKNNIKPNYQDLVIPGDVSKGNIQTSWFYFRDDFNPEMLKEIKI